MANEKRFIDANALDFDFPVTDDLIEMGIEMVRARVVTAPTVDAVEVKNGRWEHAPDYAEYCSVCGCYPDEEANHGYNYCPNCGAKMDAKE